MAVTVAFEELAGSPNEEYFIGGFSATRQLKCKWADLHKLAQQFAGVGANIRIGYDSYSSARVTGVSIAPFHDGEITGYDREASYENALITVTYRTPDGYDIPDPEQLVTESLEPWSEFITIPGRKLYWHAEGVVKDGKNQGVPLGDAASPGKLIHGATWVYRIHQVPNLPPAYFSLIGKVNLGKATSKSLGATFEPETLLFNPPTVQRIITSDGAQAWDVTLRMSWRETGWNNFYDPTRDDFFKTYVKGGKEQFKTYEPAAFTGVI